MASEKCMTSSFGIYWVRKAEQPIVAERLKGEAESKTVVLNCLVVSTQVDRLIALLRRHIRSDSKLVGGTRGVDPIQIDSRKSAKKNLARPFFAPWRLCARLGLMCCPIPTQIHEVNPK